MVWDTHKRGEVHYVYSYTCGSPRPLSTGRLRSELVHIIANGRLAHKGLEPEEQKNFKVKLPRFL